MVFIGNKVTVIANVTGLFAIVKTERNTNFQLMVSDNIVLSKITLSVVWRVDFRKKTLGAVSLVRDSNPGER